MKIHVEINRHTQNGSDETESPTSLLPRPKPLMTFPFSFRGKGGLGPSSGPAVRGRGSEGRIIYRTMEMDTSSIKADLNIQGYGEKQQRGRATVLGED